MPWSCLLALIGPHYPKARPTGGRPPMPLETMLRVFLLQQWYAVLLRQRCHHEEQGWER